MEDINTLRIDSISRPLMIGEMFTVACLVKRDEYNNIIAFTPVINTPHSDKENGQPEIHYHADFRFVVTEKSTDTGIGMVITDERIGFNMAKARVELGIDGELEYHTLSVMGKEHYGTAQTMFIRNSKLNHKCITNNKCPHRGFDLSQIVPVDGIITCPLHGLRFHSESGNITDECIEGLESAHKSDVERKKRNNLLVSKISNIDGKIISLELYNELEKLNSIYRTKQTPIDEYFYCEWQRTQPDEYTAKELENQPIIRFRVKR